MKVPITSVSPDYIEKSLEAEAYQTIKPTAKIVYLGQPPAVDYFIKSKKGNSWPMASLTFHTRHETIEIKVNDQQGKWLAAMLGELSISNNKTYTLQEVKNNYDAAGLEDFELFWDNKPVSGLSKAGLLVL